MVAQALQEGKRPDSAFYSLATTCSSRRSRTTTVIWRLIPSDRRLPWSFVGSENGLTGRWSSEVTNECRDRPNPTSYNWPPASKETCSTTVGHVLRGDARAVGGQ